jgi:hypothetical protein
VLCQGQAYPDAFVLLERRIRIFLNLPVAALDNVVVKKEITKIGRQ